MTITLLPKRFYFLAYLTMLVSAFCGPAYAWVIENNSTAGQEVYAGGVIFGDFSAKIPYKERRYCDGAAAGCGFNRPNFTVFVCDSMYSEYGVGIPLGDNPNSRGRGVRVNSNRTVSVYKDERCLDGPVKKVDCQPWNYYMRLGPLARCQ